uniref:Uncharacterized protein n=1 Tax=Parascaris equorum TaxID=6256 RepID=A0A914RCQ7_PAREQ
MSQLLSRIAFACHHATYGQVLPLDFTFRSIRYLKSIPLGKAILDERVVSLVRTFFFRLHLLRWCVLLFIDRRTLEKFDFYAESFLVLNLDRE